MSHHKLNIDEREKIAKMRYSGYSVTAIAEAVCRHKSTVSRELRRLEGEYSCTRAQEDADVKQKACHPKRRLSDTVLKEYASDKILDGWSPEQIAGRAVTDGMPALSAQTIRRAVDDGLLPNITREHLPQKGKHRKSKETELRGKLTDTRSISERPAECEERTELFHWEGDTVRGKQGTGGILTLVDRASRYLVAVKLEDCKAHTVVGAMKGLHDISFTTLTFDNGKEFALHKEIEIITGCNVFFAAPHHPWERGSNENTNGRLRRFFPKGIDMRTVTQCMLDEAVRAMNNTPRKCLGYQTPAEVFFRS